MVFLPIQITGTDVIQVIFGAQKNRKLICIDLTDRPLHFSHDHEVGQIQKKTSSSTAKIRGWASCATSLMEKNLEKVCNIRRRCINPRCVSEIKPLIINSIHDLDRGNAPVTTCLIVLH